MHIYIDADGCPVVDLTLRIAAQFRVPCTILCDSAHVIERADAETITVAKGPDSVDFRLVNLIGKGNVAITQDYGLAAMCLARGAIPIHQNGIVYTNENIDALLHQRHLSRKFRAAGGRTKGPRPRTHEDNEPFERTLTALLEKQL